MQAAPKARALVTIRLRVWKSGSTDPWIRVKPLGGPGGLTLAADGEVCHDTFVPVVGQPGQLLQGGDGVVASSCQHNPCNTTFPEHRAGSNVSTFPDCHPIPFLLPA